MEGHMEEGNMEEGHTEEGHTEEDHHMLEAKQNMAMAIMLEVDMDHVSEIIPPNTMQNVRLHKHY